jgi:hypothetical protein
MAETARGDGLFPPGAYGRDDESPDGDFYRQPRKVVHLDAAALEGLARAYARVLPPAGRLLDLMSSWRSHLPAGWREREVVGLGLNAEEMADNPHLTRHVVHDLNREAQLPFADGEFDGAMCAVSIQYVLHPLRVLREVRRVLRPGAPFVVSFSNRCFPTKAVAIWQGTTDEEHVALVRTYFNAAGGWTEPEEDVRATDGDGDPLYILWARAALTPGRQ